MIKKRKEHLVDITGTVNCRVKLKEDEKLDKYQDPAKEGNTRENNGDSDSNQCSWSSCLTQQETGKETGG